MSMEPEYLSERVKEALHLLWTLEESLKLDGKYPVIQYRMGLAAEAVSDFLKEFGQQQLDTDANDPKRFELVGFYADEFPRRP